MGKTEKKYKKKPLAVVHVKPVTGALGTTIQPGEEVMVVRSGYGNSVGCDKGIYIGYIISEPRGERRARVSMQKSKFEWYHQDGQPFNWKDYDYRTWEEVKKTLTMRETEYEVITTLWLNRIAAIK